MLSGWETNELTLKDGKRRVRYASSLSFALSISIRAFSSLAIVPSAISWPGSASTFRASCLVLRHRVARGAGDEQ